MPGQPVDLRNKTVQCLLDYRKKITLTVGRLFEEHKKHAGLTVVSFSTNARKNLVSEDAS